MIYALIGCLIIIGFLGFKLYRKQILDTKERDKLKEEVYDLRNLRQYAEEDLKLAKEKTDHEKTKLNEWKKELQSVQIAYSDLVDTRMKTLDESIEEQRKKRQAELDINFREKQIHYDTLLDNIMRQYEEQKRELKDQVQEVWNSCIADIEAYRKSTQLAKDKFEGIERVLRTYDAEQQAKLFYTIQLPEEYQEDIDFLLTTVAQKVMHPDIISKLVWAEYVKPNLDDTFKRVEVKPEAGIYKLTSLQNGKCYIGKSTNVKNRIADHFKSSIGIKSIADQAVHHAILKEGFWNWQIEIITYCDKDKLNELEKYYIEFFKAQEFGYNKTGGG